MLTWRICVALMAVFLMTLSLQVNARPSKENFLIKFFDSVIPWRRSSSSNLSTTTPNIEIESILNKIDTSPEEYVKITNGQLFLNGTELLAVDSNGSTVDTINAAVSLEKNSSFKEVTILKNANASSNVSIPENYRKLPPLHRRMTGSRTCDQLSTAQKYKKLEKIGAKNPMFMAASLAEGKYGFKPLISRNESRKYKEFEHLSDAVKMRTLTGVLEEDEDDDDYCDEFCQEVTHAIKKLEEKKDVVNIQPYNIKYDDTIIDHLSAEPLQCVLDDFVHINKECNHNRGSSDNYEGLSKLCSACQGIYRLADNCFPNLINGIQCSQNADQSNCIFLHSQSNGRCKTKTVPITILRNIGTLECENWVRETIAVPIACECYLSDNAPMSAVPRP